PMLPSSACEMNRTPFDTRASREPVEGRTTGLQVCPDLFLLGLAATIGLGVWAYDRHWQSGALGALIVLPLLGVLYPLPARLFGWPSARWFDLAGSALDLMDTILGLLSLFP